MTPLRSGPWLIPGTRTFCRCAPLRAAADSRALSAGALANRVHRAVEVHLPPPDANQLQYTLHSFRRGRLQHERDRGATRDQLGALSGIKTDCVLNKYLDQGRHLLLCLPSRSRAPAGGLPVAALPVACW